MGRWSRSPRKGGTVPITTGTVIALRAAAATAVGTFAVAGRSLVALPAEGGTVAVTLGAAGATTVRMFTVAKVVALRTIRARGPVADRTPGPLVIAGRRPTRTVTPLAAFTTFLARLTGGRTASTRTTRGGSEPTSAAGSAGACAALTAAGWSPVATVATSCTRFSHADLPPTRVERGVLVTVHIELELQSGPASHVSR